MRCLSLQRALQLMLFLQLDAVHGEYSFKRDNVLPLDSNNFNDIVLYSPKVTIVLFYSPTCPHCIKLAPAFKEAAKTLAPEDIKLAALDATQFWDIAQHYDVRGYPTVKIFVPVCKNLPACCHQ